MKKEISTTLTLRAPISIKTRLEILANKEGRTLNSMMNKILKDYFDDIDEKNKARK